MPPTFTGAGMPADEPFDPQQPLWREGYILFRPHKGLYLDFLFNRKVRTPFPFTITQCRRDDTTVRWVCQQIAERVHLTDTRWPDVVLY